MAAFANSMRGERRDVTGEQNDDYVGMRRRKVNRDRREPMRVNVRLHEGIRGHGRRGPTRSARMGTEEFKCGHCRAFIGPTVSCGRHRNHCPLCLHSRHVDDNRPGDRASDCRASMAPVARFDRPGGEPVIVHRCLGCGLERHNLLAADDNLVLLIRLPLVAPRLGRAVDPGAAPHGEAAVPD